MLQKSNLSLTADPTKKYNKREEAIFEYLTTLYPKEPTTKELAAFVLNPEKILHPQNTIITTLNHMKRKMLFNGEPLTLKLTNPGGPRPMTVALTKRGNDE